VFVGCLFAQQVCLIVGIRVLPLLNLCTFYDRGIGANSLSYEPSTFARLLTIFYYAIVKCTEFRQGHKVRITEIFRGDIKWISIFYAWSILTMGSGTAFVAAGILSIYFMQGRYIFLSIPVFVGIYFIMENSDNESFDRAKRTSEAMMTGSADEVIATDGSAATRIAPMLNTLHADFTQVDFWIGKGCDSGGFRSFASCRGNMAHIDDYGLISYILELTLVFCCIINFRSIETLFYFAGIGGGVVSVSYAWGILMIFTCLKYFDSQKYYYNRLEYEED
jgi:hypothetical protein